VELLSERVYGTENGAGYIVVVSMQ